MARLMHSAKTLTVQGSNYLSVRVCLIPSHNISNISIILVFQTLQRWLYGYYT